MMRRRILNVGGTEVWLHLATLLFAAYMIALGRIRLLAVGFVSILLHEGAHAAVSAAFGNPPRDIEVTPLGALMRLEEEDALPPLKRFAVLLAGPAVTLGLAFGAIWLTRAGTLSMDLGRLVFSSNLAILFINLLPALPLDAGRMLALVLGALCRPETVKRTLRTLGSILGCLCITLNVAVSWFSGGWNLSMAACGCFLIYAASVGTATTAMAELRRFMARKVRVERRGGTRGELLVAMAGWPLRRAVTRLHPSRYTLICVLREGSMRNLGVWTESELIAAYMNAPGEKCGTLAKKGEAGGKGAKG